MLYPFTFKPVFKEVIWGGTGILPYKGLMPDTRKIGESWELSAIEGNLSVVANGELEGKTITELIEAFGSSLVGEKILRTFGTQFPLLIKFIDANANLSVQVHPNDVLAMKRHRSFGKTEMWYIVKAAPDAVLYSGFSQQVDADEYVRRIANNSLMDVLQPYKVKVGDIFFLPAGRVHAIGSGCFIAEIQQTSDITYRIYDYNRKDAHGDERELHTELAKEAIDYTLYQDYQTYYTPTINEITPLVQSRYFTTNLLQMTKTITRDFAMLDSFVIYICTAGMALLKDDNGNETPVNQGQTILIPAETNSITIEPHSDSTLLETYINGSFIHTV